MYSHVWSLSMENTWNLNDFDEDLDGHIKSYRT